METDMTKIDGKLNQVHTVLTNLCSKTNITLSKSEIAEIEKAEELLNEARNDIAGMFT